MDAVVDVRYIRRYLAFQGNTRYLRRIYCRYTLNKIVSLRFLSTCLGLSMLRLCVTKAWMTANKLPMMLFLFFSQSFSFFPFFFSFFVRFRFDLLFPSSGVSTGKIKSYSED